MGRDVAARETDAALVVLAEAPRPGHVAARLIPPLTPEQAADLAAACLLDTLDVATAVRGAEPVVALSGSLRRSARFAAIKGALRRVRIVSQPGDAPAGLIEPGGRVALHIGTQTPQVTPTLVGDALQQLRSPGVDAVLGPTPDGRRWAVGLRDPQHATLLHDIPVDDAERTLHALRAAGLHVELLPELVLADTVAGVVAVAGAAPWTRLAAVAGGLPLQGEAGSQDAAATPSSRSGTPSL